MPLAMLRPTPTRLALPDEAQMLPVGATGPTRRQFVIQLRALMGDARLMWMPLLTDTTTTTTVETETGRVVTYDATAFARRSALGQGVAQTFVTASSQYGDTPDTANLSFGNGTTDQAFSGVVLANVTDSAAIRTLVAKRQTSNTEWEFHVNTLDTIIMNLQDDSAGVAAQRIGDAPIAQGIWGLLGWSYDGTGGATAANGMTLYQNGAVFASTASTNASYAAMENLAAPVEIGTRLAHTATFFGGSLALIAICAKNLTPSEHAAIAALVRRFFGVAL